MKESNVIGIKQDNDLGQLIDFIGEGKKQISMLEQEDDRLKKQKDLVLIVGTTGVGKSTLVNYLNDIALVCKPDGSKYKLSLADQNNRLPGGFDIGDNAFESKTLYPGVYSPSSETYSYIDCPGFGDSRGLMIDIANLFFREDITMGADRLKFILTVSNDDLTSSGRGYNFLKSLQSLSAFVGAINSGNNIDLLKNSIGMVVTQVPDPTNSEIKNLEQVISETNEEIVEYTNTINSMLPLLDNPPMKIYIERDQKKLTALKEKSKQKQEELEQFVKRIKPIKKSVAEQLNNFIEAKTQQLTKNEQQLLDHLVKNEQFEVFSNPMQNGKIALSDKDKILDMLKNKMKFLDREVAEITVKIPDTYSGKLLDFVKSKMQIIESKLKDQVLDGVNKFLSQELELAKSDLDLVRVKEVVKAIIKNGMEIKGLGDFILSIYEIVIEEGEKRQLIELSEIIELLTALLPEEYQTNFNYNKRYLDELQLTSYLKETQTNLDKICNYQEVILGSEGVSYRGYFVKISEVAAQINEYKISSNVPLVKIYALNTVIWDANLIAEKLKGSDVVVIAPKWDVVKSAVTLNISGLNQNNYPEDAMKAQDAVDTGGHDGMNGMDGLAGEDGGNFIGLGKQYYQISNLQIIANGGDGGIGQGGGNGSDGGRGVNALISEVTNSKEHYVDKEIATSGGYNYYYVKKGGSGELGGNAGKGGIGGIGGKSGQIELYDKDMESLFSQVSVTTLQGSRGSNGKSGSVGIGGDYGNDAVRIYYTNKKLDLTPGELKAVDCGWKSGYIVPSEKRAANGKEASEYNMQVNDPKPENQDEDQDKDKLNLQSELYNCLMEYKEFYDENILNHQNGPLALNNADANEFIFLDSIRILEQISQINIDMDNATTNIIGDN